MNLEDYRSKYEAFSDRERVLLLCVAAVVIYLLVSTLAFTPMGAKKESDEKRLQQLHSEITTQKNLKQLYMQSMSQDPDAAKKRQLNGFKVQLEKLEVSLSELSVGLVPAEKLPVLLESVLARSEGLELSEVQTLPITELSLRSAVVQVDDNRIEDSVLAAEMDADTTEKSAGVFKHSVRVTLKGGYFDVLKYFQALESLPWRLFWERMDYSVEQYPQAEVEFEVYTLSTQQGVFRA